MTLENSFQYRMKFILIPRFANMIDENKFSNNFYFSWQALLQYKVRSRKVTSGSTPAKKSQKEMLQSSSPSKKASMTTGIQVFYLIVSILINKTFIL